jgi:quinol monooxygenase YgiN
MVVNVVTVYVKPECVADFIVATLRNHGLSRQEPGNRRFDVLRAEADPNRFVLYEAFDSMDAVEAHLRRVAASFGPLTDAQWRHLATHSAVRDGEGWRLHHDPAIGESFKATPPADVDLWPVWDAIAQPVLVLRGAEERLAPILMTASCAALALLPLVISGNIPGHEIEFPMAVVILGGLVTSTTLNLFLLPVLYAAFGQSRHRTS